MLLMQQTLSPVERVDQVIERNMGRYVEDMKEAVRHPSVSTTGKGIRDMAQFLVEHFKSIGFGAQLLETGGHPAVFGVVNGRGPGTLLIYGHYDVQPVEPLSDWHYPPFGAVQDGDRIYGRGTTDDKGVFLSAVKAVQSYIEAGIQPPVTVKFIIDGEEEIGSPHLESVVRQNAQLLQADALVGAEGSIYANGRPEMVMGTKGMLYVELVAHGSGRDLHSGKAPVVKNPAWRLSWALATLKTPDGRVHVPGFYDGIVRPSEQDIELLKSSEITDDLIKADIGVDEFMGNKTDLELLEALCFEPTFNIAGLSAGYPGPGSKTVLPGQASAKIDMRLVPGQNPRRILDGLRTHLHEHGFDDIEIINYGGMPAGRSPIDTPIVAATHRALGMAYGKRPVAKPMIEATGPGYVYSAVMRIPWLWARLGPTENRMHAPNEYTTINAYATGMKAVARLLVEFAGVTR